MRSPFCQWLIDLSEIAAKDNVVVEAKYFDGLDYYFKKGDTPTEAYPDYLNLVKRITAIQKNLGIEKVEIMTEREKIIREVANYIGPAFPEAASHGTKLNWQLLSCKKL